MLLSALYLLDSFRRDIKSKIGSGDREKIVLLLESVSKISSVLSKRDCCSANGEAAFVRAAAMCVMMFEQSPGAYEKIFAKLAKDSDWRLNTLEGLSMFADFLFEIRSGMVGIENGVFVKCAVPSSSISCERFLSFIEDIVHFEEDAASLMSVASGVLSLSLS